MKFFIDTADLQQIETAMGWGCMAGVTTNPTLYARTGGKLADFENHMVKIAHLCEGLPVSAESTATTTDEMVAEGKRLAALAPNIVVKLPICAESLAATKQLKEAGVNVNMTLIFNVTQALMACAAGARYVSPFVGRFDDIAEDGIEQLSNIIVAVKNYYPPEHTEIIAASLRTPHHVAQAALLGSDIATVPFDALEKCLKHPLTQQGLASFEKDWASVK